MGLQGLPGAPGNDGSKGKIKKIKQYYKIRSLSPEFNSINENT